MGIEATYRYINEISEYNCIVKDLSASGLKLTTKKSILTGCKLRIFVSTTNKLTPPLNVNVVVSRSTKTAIPGQYEIACKIDTIHDT
jgi:hypothetical protein